MKSQWRGFQSPLAEGIRSFLAHKRSLGRRFDTEEKTLRPFDRFLAEHKLSRLEDLTSELLNAFLATRSQRRARSFNQVLGIVRGLLEWLVQRGVLDHSPLQVTPRRTTARRIPYLFDVVQARRLLQLAGGLADNPRAPLRGPTYRTVFAVLYGLGLRVGEVCRLRRADVDFDRRLLVVRDTKFGKSRLVPFGPRMGTLLHDYLELRAPTGLAPDAPVFSFTRRGPVHPGTISQTFHQLLPRLALEVPRGVAPPHLHDLRHAFAVGTLLRWYRNGMDPATRLFHLSTFLGHVNPSSTAVYLTITDQLLDEANRRFEGVAAAVIAEASP